MTASLFIIVAMNAGYWIGGERGSVRFAWTIEADRPRVQAIWALSAGETDLAGGRTALDPAKDQIVIDIQTPPVRTRTTVAFRYRVTSEPGDVLASGTLPIDLFPPGLLDDLVLRFDAGTLMVWDDAAGLAQVLADARIQFTRIDDVGGLNMTRPRVILVGVDQLDDQAMSQAALLGHARAGASVVVFAQRRASSVLGYSLTLRHVLKPLDAREQHTLLAGLERRDIDALPAPVSHAVRLPAGEPALEILYWPPETADADGEQPVPIDALIVTKAVGQGRITLVQCPVERWRDPLAQLLLRGALEHALTRPEPTPPPSQRSAAPAPSPSAVPTIEIPTSGARR